MSVDGKKKESGVSTKRREHTSRILTEKKIEKTSSEFISMPQFKNYLPHLPSGPYFKKVELINNFKDYGSYIHPTSLERSFVWQPHYNNDVGLNVDLVDQSQILVHEKVTSLNQSDAKYLSTGGQVRRGGREAVEDIHWLKKPTYSMNDLFDNVNKFKMNEELDTQYFEGIKKQMGNTGNVFSVSSVELSFDAVVNKTNSMLKESEEVEWCLPVLPDDDHWMYSLSHVRFEDGVLVPDEISSAVDNPEENSRSKRRRIDNAIMSNIRPMESSNGLSFIVSYSLPEKESEAEMYAWHKDFRMEIKGSGLEDNFRISVDVKKKIVSYCPLRSKMDVHKIKSEFYQPVDLVVSRRDMLDNEKSDASLLLNEKKL